MIIAGFVWYSPFFLLYSGEGKQGVKSNSIAYLMGTPDLGREREVWALIQERVGGVVLIPGSGKVLRVENIKNGESIRNKVADDLFTGIIDQNKMPEYSYFEGTHIEALNLKDMMTQWGLKSAILVSSPYHMRRIKIIMDWVFDDSAVLLSYSPSRFENPRPGSWLFNTYDRNWVVSEYLKILWFFLYGFTTEI